MSHASKNLLNSCVEKCEKCINSCQKLMAICEVKNSRECADQVGMCIRTCQECVQVCNKTLNDMKLHAKDCADCKTHMKSLQECVNACTEQINVLNKTQQHLPTNVSAVNFKADVDRLMESTKKCIEKCGACAKSCGKK